MIIYKLTNKINGKVYIGQTVQELEKRFKAHYKHKANTYIKNAILYYGVDNFEREVIDTATNIEELNEKEAYWIFYYHSTDRQKGYNRESGGKNYTVNDETRKLMSEAHKRRYKDITEEEKQSKMQKLREGYNKMSPETLARKVQKQADRIRGRKLGPQNPETIAKRVQKIKGRKASSEARQRMSEAQKLAATKVTPEEKARREQKRQETRRKNREKQS
jgi:group I intron endonuclease